MAPKKRRRRSRHRLPDVIVREPLPANPQLSPEDTMRRNSYDASDVQFPESSACAEVSALFPLPEQENGESSPLDVQDAEDIEDLEDDHAVETSTPVLGVTNWRVLWGLLVTNGSLKFTKSQYQSMRILADTFGRISDPSWRTVPAEISTSSLPRQRIISLPHYSTLYKTFKPVLYRTLAVRGRETLEEVCMRKAGARARKYSDDGAPLVAVQTVLPSEYAREDVACGPVFDLMCSTSLTHAKSGEDCVDKWPLVSARSWFYGTSSYISVDDSALVAVHQPFAEPGDAVSVQLIHSAQFQSEIREAFASPATSTTSDSRTLTGKVVHVWTVHHARRRGDVMFHNNVPDYLHPRDKLLVSTIQFVKYTSPSDAVNVTIPVLPTEHTAESTEGSDNPVEDTEASRRKKLSPQMVEAIRRRKSALAEHRIQMQEAWADWRKPLWKPGDIVALREPFPSPQGMARMSTRAASSRLLIVQRFWTESEESSRHICWVRSGNDITAVEDRQISSGFCGTIWTERNEFYADVRHISLLFSTSTKRGHEKLKPVSSHGVLNTGEPYFIYRFLLFWDGFEITRGKSASGEGFYMLCLNLPPKARSSPDAVRIISLSPPGVKSNVIFKNIQADIVKGMTEGFSDYDPNGNRIRIFLDLVGFIGDTPALNATLDVLGHTGRACCHLCTFVRGSSALVGSRYTRLSIHGLCTNGGRGFYQHCAQRDSEAKEETCRQMGLSSPDLQKILPLHDLRSAMISSRHLIPRSNSGVPIISGDLDPYRSCLIGPDHLLTGHFRDCVNAAFRLLPSKSHCQSVEAFLVGLLSDCGLPTQNRIFDIENKSLFSMSMSELNALSIVAELGFLRGCSSLCSAPLHVSLSSKCIDSISLVGSCSNLISRLWKTEALAPASQSFGLGLIAVQRLTRRHIKDVEMLCTMEDGDTLLLEHGRPSKSRRSELLKEQRLCRIAIKSIDKPNVHRLFELVHSTLPMIGHVSRVGELVLEKAHQTLKRAVFQSNNREAHIQSVLTAVFTDWQGRLTMQVKEARSGNVNAIRGCLRLLAGREAIEAMDGRISQRQIDMVLSVLGPECCVPALLEHQAKSVVSTKCGFLQEVSWALETNKELISSQSRTDSQHRSAAYHAFSRLYKIVEGNPSLLFADSVCSTYANGQTGILISCGNVIAVECRHTHNSSAHFPLVSQCFFAPKLPSDSTETGTLFWGVLALFTTKNAGASNEVWAAVYPCQQVHQDAKPYQLYYSKPTYVFCRRFSFLRMDPTVRLVATVPVCADNTCAPSLRACRIVHANNCRAISGTPFFLFSREEGYPPRQG